MNLSSLNQQQLVKGVQDLLTAIGQRFSNPTQDMVVLEDVTQIAASLGVPGAEEVDVSLVLISTIGTVLYPLWIPPWDPSYVPPNSNIDPTSRPGR